MAKKQRKAYNPHKRLQRVAKATMKKLGVIYVGGNGNKCRMVDASSGRIYNPDQYTATAVSEVRFNWSIFCAVFLRDQEGVEYMKSLTIQVNEPARQQDIAEQVGEIHTELVQGINKKHLVNVGWIARPDGVEMTEQEAGILFDKADAWDSLATWEAAA